METHTLFQGERGVNVKQQYAQARTMFIERTRDASGQPPVVNEVRHAPARQGTTSSHNVANGGRRWETEQHRTEGATIRAGEEVSAANGRTHETRTTYILHFTRRNAAAKSTKSQIFSHEAMKEFLKTYILLKDRIPDM